MRARPTDSMLALADSQTKESAEAEERISGAASTASICLQVALRYVACGHEQDLAPFRETSTL